MLSIGVFKHFFNHTKLFVRFKNSSVHGSIHRKKVEAVDKALAHFDDFYKQVFTLNWPSIREGLLGKRKYVAVVNNYGDSDETMAKFELQGALNVRTLFDLEKEYSRDRLKKQERRDRLEKIRQMDEEIEKRADEEAPLPSSRDFSLQSKLDSAEIDQRRVIDVDNVLSAESLHEFIPATKIKGKEDFIPESTHYQYYSTDKFDVLIEKEYEIKFPAHLNVYCFEEGNSSDFDPALNASTGVLNYYLMDGGSIFPILALDIQPGDRVLDLCAAPGGKSLLAIQTLHPDCVVSNDISISRTNRIHSVFKQFLYDLDDRWIKTNKLKITNHDGRFLAKEEFDRILVDVPCTTDRHSLVENDNNFFKPSRIKERLKLPELQCELLVNALKLVRKGGIVVYSTCSLSPIQNDGVVHMALKKIWEDTKIEITVQDLGPALYQTKNVFKFARKKLMKYGHLILPHIDQNYGPTYFCKLKRIK